MSKPAEIGIFDSVQKMIVSSAANLCNISPSAIGETFIESWAVLPLNRFDVRLL